jgi:hypothetical protein
MTKKYIHKIYSSEYIDFKFENNFKQVISNSLIKKGELLVVEHSICATNQILEKWLILDIQSSNELYPREDNSTIQEKIMCNCFSTKEYSESLLMLAIQQAWFNTSTNYNAGATCELINKNNTYLYDDILITFVIALKDIQPEEEIFIYYQRDSCGVQFNEQLQTEYYQSIMSTFSLSRKLFLKLLRDYLLTSTCFQVYLTHIRLKYETPNDDYPLSNLLKSKINNHYLYSNYDTALTSIIKLKDIFKIISDKYDELVENIN